MSKQLTLLSFAAAATCASAQAQTAPVQYAALSPVVVTATRTDRRVDDLVADVTVLTRDDLERAAGHTLAELLGSLPGLQSASNGGAGQTANVYMRGLEARHTLLLIDGMRVGSATTGEPAWATLPMADIERVEVVRGPLASLYGSDAVAGVVQVFTRRPQAGSAVNASIGAGRYGQAEASAGWRGAEGPWSAALQFSHDQANGFSATNARNTYSYNPDKDGYERNAGSAQLGLRIGGDWRAQAQLFNVESTNDYDDGPGAVPARYVARSQVLGTEVGGSVLAGWRTKFGVTRSTDGYDTQQVTSAFSETGNIATVQRQYRWENTVDTPIGTALVLGEHLFQGVEKPGSGYVVRERRVNALALGLNGEAGDHLWQLSGRVDNNSQYGRQKNGTVAYGWRFLPGWTLGGQYGTAFVAPSFNDLYWPFDGYSQGNPNLRPSRSRSAEVSVGFKRDEVEAKATLHRSRVSDLIQWVESPVGSFQYTPMNVARAAIDGVTLQAQAPLAGLLWMAGFDWLKARDQDTGLTLARRAPRVARLAADRQQGEWRYGTAVSAYASRWSDAANTQRLTGYALVDLHATWQFAREWSATARLNNLLDRQYETVYGYNQPGRALAVVLRYQGH